MEFDGSAGIVVEVPSFDRTEMSEEVNRMPSNCTEKSQNSSFNSGSGPTMGHANTDAAMNLVMKFVTERRSEAHAMYRASFHLGLVLLAIAFTGIGVGSLLRELLPRYPAISVLVVVGYWCRCLGLVVVSTCGPEDDDISTLIAERPALRSIGGLMWAACEVARAVQHAPACVLTAAFALCAASDRVSTVFKRHLATVLPQALAFSQLGNFLTLMIMSLGETRSPPFFLLLGFIWIEFYWCRKKFRRGVVCATALYTCCYIYILTDGLHMIHDGLMGLSFEDDDLEHVCAGVGTVLPLAFLGLFGRRWWFGLLSRRFERDPNRYMKDAAFVVWLMDKTFVHMGEEWWRYRPREDVEVDACSTSCHFEKGVVIRVRKDTFTVRFPTTDAKGTNVETFPMLERNTDFNDLMVSAYLQLRCMEWKDLTMELLASGPICGGNDTDLEANVLLQFSRPLAQGERIDFFLSHCWHDDPAAKYEALTHVVEEFKHKYGREPTFWLDKTCIDQRSVGDGLRVLPLTIMSCKQLLMLCGPRYPQRLWCVWELFTLMAFFRSDLAMERIIPVPFEPAAAVANDDTHPGHSTPLQGLCTFDVANAKCFDPNDNRRLRRVIRAVGEAIFNARIRELGEMCRHRKPGKSRFSFLDDVTYAIEHCASRASFQSFASRTYSDIAASPSVTRQQSSSACRSSGSSARSCASDMPGDRIVVVV